VSSIPRGDDPEDDSTKILETPVIIHPTWRHKPQEWQHLFPYAPIFNKQYDESFTTNQLTN